MRKLFTEIKLFLKRVVNSPVGELSRAQRFLRYCYDLVVHCSRALAHDRAGEMAAALTYRTIFSLIPFLVMVLLVFQAFRGLDQVKQDLQPLFYRFMKIDSVSLPDAADIIKDAKKKEDEKKQDDAKKQPEGSDPGKDGASKQKDDVPSTTQPPAPPAPPAPPVPAPPVVSNPQTPPTGPPSAVVVETNPAGDKTVTTVHVDEAAAKRVSVDSFLTDVINKVSSLNFASIGAVGFVLFLWAAIELVVTIELSFNRVFNSQHGRPWHRRIPIYLAVITLGPVLIWGSLSLAGALVTSASSVPWLSAIVAWTSNLFALAASWLLLFLLYKLMPNAVVNVGPALAGAFVAACLWELAKYGFSIYVNQFLPYAKIYGALGLIPLFFFWLYLTWWIVLFGLELTYTLQAMEGKKFKYALPAPAQQQQQDVRGDSQWIVPIMTQIGKAFVTGKAIDSYGLSERLNLPDRLVVSLCARLEKEGLVHRVVQGDDTTSRYALALPPEQIPLVKLLEIIESLRDCADKTRDQAGWLFLQRMTQIQREAVAGQTLAQVLKEKPPEPPAQQEPCPAQQPQPAS